MLGQVNMQKIRLWGVVIVLLGVFVYLSYTEHVQIKSLTEQVLTLSSRWARATDTLDPGWK